MECINVDADEGDVFSGLSCRHIVEFRNILLTKAFYPFLLKLIKCQKNLICFVDIN